MTHTKEEIEMNQENQIKRFREILAETGDRVTAATVAMKDMDLTFDEVVDLSWAEQNATAPRTHKDRFGNTVESDYREDNSYMDENYCCR